MANELYLLDYFFKFTMSIVLQVPASPKISWNRSNIAERIFYNNKRIIIVAVLHFSCLTKSLLTKIILRLVVFSLEPCFCIRRQSSWSIWCFGSVTTANENLHQTERMFVSFSSQIEAVEALPTIHASSFTFC